MFSGFNFQVNHRKDSVACVFGDVTRWEGESRGIKGMGKGRRWMQGDRFWKLSVFLYYQVTLTFLSEKVAIARLRPTPRNIFMKNVRSAAFAQKQEIHNISSIKKALLWQLVTGSYQCNTSFKMNACRISRTRATVPAFHNAKTAAPVMIASTLLGNPALAGSCGTAGF